MRCVSKGVDTIGVAWSAKKSSLFSRDSQQLQIRGCVGPLDKALATKWMDIDEKFALEGGLPLPRLRSLAAPGIICNPSIFFASTLT